MTTRFRFYRTAQRDTVREELAALPAHGRAAVVEAMVRRRHDASLANEIKPIAGDILELRATSGGQAFRLLFAAEGKGHVLLALVAFEKKTRKTPKATVDLAKRRLSDWRASPPPDRQ